MYVGGGEGAVKKKKGASSVGSCHFPVRLLHSSLDQSAACACVCVHVRVNVSEYLCVFVGGTGADFRALGIKRQRSSSSFPYSPYLQHR